MFSLYEKLDALTAGRSSRSQYWLAQPFICVLFVAYVVVTMSHDWPEGFTWLRPVLLGLTGIGSFGLSGVVTIRRLHDLGRSSWYYLASLIPFYGLYLMCLVMFVRGQEGDNRFGPEPH